MSAVLANSGAECFELVALATPVEVNSDMANQEWLVRLEVFPESFQETDWDDYRIQYVKEEESNGSRFIETWKRHATAYRKPDHLVEYA